MVMPSQDGKVTCNFITATATATTTTTTTTTMMYESYNANHHRTLKFST
jgi:hypothetical protein